MSKKKALVKGERQGELIRLKQTLKRQNDIIQKSKQKDAEASSAFTSDNIKTQGSGGTNTSSQKLYDRVETQTPSRVVRFPSLVMERPRAAIKNLDDLKNKPDLVRFYIRQKFGADIPCNAKLESYQQGDEQHHKIEKYFKGKGQNEDEVIMFAYLYDDNLREIDGIKYTDSLVAKTNLPRTETRTKIKDLLDVEARSRR